MRLREWRGGFLGGVGRKLMHLETEQEIRLLQIMAKGVAQEPTAADTQGRGCLTVGIGECDV